MEKMTSQQQNNKRIAKNTLFLYFRMLLTMVVSLYTSRVVLQTLGVENFGIYNVVGSTIGIISFLTASMSTATQRFISFNLDLNNDEKLRKIFSSSLILHALLAILIVCIMETLGLWFFYNKLQIPENRIDAAFWVYQFSIFTSVISIIFVPYNALIVAHEKMKAFAYISFFEAFAKLIVVYLLIVSPFDKLIVYSIMLTCIQLLIGLLYTVFCRRHFTEAKFTFKQDKTIFKEIKSFIGWIIFGQFGCMCAIHGQNILLNMFFGPAVNAARGITNQVNFIINSFATNFQMAINPQITKSYATGNLERHHKLIYTSTKFSCLLTIFLSLPLLMETDFILQVWLKNVPNYTVTFLRITLIIAIFDSTANAVAISAQATGRIKYYQITCGFLLFMTLPTSYVLLRCGFEAKSVLFVHLFFTMLTQVARVSFLRYFIQFNILKMIKIVYIPCSLILLLSMILPTIIMNEYSQSFLRFIANTSLSFVVCATFIFLFGMNVDERKFLYSFIKKRNKF